MEKWWKVSNLETVPTRKYPIPGLHVPYLTLPILPYPTLPDLLDYHHPLYSLSLCLSPSLFHILGQPTHPPSHPHTLTIITHTSALITPTSPCLRQEASRNGASLQSWCCAPATPHSPRLPLPRPAGFPRVCTHGTLTFEYGGIIGVWQETSCTSRRRLPCTLPC